MLTRGLPSGDHGLVLCDLGMARKVVDVGTSGSDDDDSRPWTEYVTTRWYRAPEVLCQVPQRPSLECGGPLAADVWSLGCVIAEVMTGAPLFRERDAEHMLESIAGALGKPRAETAAWYVERAGDPSAAVCMLEAAAAAAEAEVPCARRPADLPLARRLDFCAYPGQSLPREQARQLEALVRSMLDYDPARRPTAAEVASHPLFAAAAAAAAVSDAKDDAEEECEEEGEERMGARRRRRPRKQQQQKLQIKGFDDGSSDECLEAGSLELERAKAEVRALAGALARAPDGRGCGCTRPPRRRFRLKAEEPSSNSSSSSADQVSIVASPPTADTDPDPL